MPTLDDAARIALSLPEVHEGLRHGHRTWFVGKAGFVWERPFSKADLKRFGPTTPPGGPILGVRVADLDEKEVVLAAGTTGVFTIPHFDGYPAVLVQLDAVAADALEEIVVDAWLASAPPALVEGFLACGPD